MTSKQLLEKAKKAFDDLEHKGYDRRSFIEGFLIGYSVRANECKSSHLEKSISDNRRYNQ